LLFHETVASVEEPGDCCHVCFIPCVIWIRFVRRQEHKLTPVTRKARGYNC